MKGIYVHLFSILIVAFFVCCEPSEFIYSEDSRHGFTEDESEQTRISEDEPTNYADEINLLENGGLEKWNTLLTQYDMPTGWNCHNNNNVKRNHNIVAEGQCSARMSSVETGSTARVDQLISVYPGQKIRIRFKYYIEQWKSKGARTYCYFRSESAEKYTISTEELNTFYDKDSYRIIRGGGYGITYFPHDLNVWQEFDETIEVPPSAFFFEFGVNSYYGTVIYIDDCFICNVTDDTSTGINPVYID